VTVRPRRFLIGLAVVVVAGLLILLFPLLSDPDRLKIFLLQQVEAAIGRKIEVGDATFELFPRPHLELSQVVIRDMDTPQVFLKAKRFDLVLRSTPLLQMQVVVKRMRIERPQMTLRRDRTGQWNFLAPGSRNAGSDGALGNPLGLVMLIQETALTEGVVTVIDEFRPDGLRTVELTDLDVAVTTPTQGLPTDIRIAGKIPSGLGTSSLSLTGTVTRVAGPSVTTQSTALQFQGALDWLRVDLRQMMDFFGPRPIPDQVHGTANLQSHIRLVPGVSGYDMVLSDMKATVENLSIAGHASLSGIMTRQPTFGLTVSATPVSLDELLSRFPAQWLSPQLQSLLAEREIKGIVEVVSATVTGSTTPTPHASVTGEFRIQQGHALLGRNKVPAKNLAGTVLLDPDRLRAADITGQYGPLQLTAGKLAIAFLDQGPSLDLDVSGTMTAAELVSALATSIESQTVVKPLAQLRDIQGHTRVTFRLSGMLNQPNGLTFSGAEIDLQNVRLKSPMLPEAVTGLTGRLAYSKAAVELDRVGGNLGRAQFQLHGTITTDKSAQFQGFSVWARASADQILSLASSRAPDNTTVQGLLGIALSLAGPVVAPQMKGVIEFNDAAVTIPSLLHKPSGQPAAIEFDAALSRDLTLTASRLDIIMPPVRLSGKGTIQLGPTLRANSSLVSGPIPLNGLPPGMVLGGFDSGTLEISLDLKGRGKNWKAWSLTGWVAVTDGRLSNNVASHAVTDIYLRVRLVRTGADIKRLEFRISDSFVRASGTIRGWRTRPIITATVESPHLDFEVLVPKGERTPVREFLENLAATSRVTATIDVTQGRYKQFALSEISSRITIGDGTLEAGRITGHIEEGTISESRFVVRLPRRRPAEGELKLQLTGLPTEKIMHLAGDDQRLVTGELTLTATMQGSGKHPRGVANTLNGNLDFRIDHGHIEKGTIVPKILMILDIPSRLQGKIDLQKEGMPFDKFSGTAAIENGILTTKNLLIDSPVIKISGAGTYVIPADELDMTVVVSPFGSYTKLLQGIPVFGRLLAGERKGFTTAFFDVKGSLKDPQVINRPMKSVGAGLTGLGQLAFDVLKNTLLLPAEIFSPGDDRTPAPQSAPPAPAGSPSPATSP
jgi:AsmA-like protein